MADEAIVGEKRPYLVLEELFRSVLGESDV
jgi:hypothetical protein